MSLGTQFSLEHRRGVSTALGVARLLPDPAVPQQGSIPPSLAKPFPGAAAEWAKACPLGTSDIWATFGPCPSLPRGLSGAL